MENNQSKHTLMIKDWDCSDRPREKLSQRGVISLTDSELLAILLRNGTHQDSVVDLSRRLLQIADNNLDTLAKMSIKELTKIKGIGLAKATTIVATFEIGKRRLEKNIGSNYVIRSSRDAYNYCAHLLMDLPYEEMYVIMLNRANTVVGREKISQGGVSASVVDLRLVLKKAIEYLASGIIIVHNHPSGNLKPSNEDKNVTLKIKEVARMLDIQLLDHLIIGGKSFLSFADQGIM